jgi:hypothetical protein
VSDDGDAAYQCWAIVERVGIQIGELPMMAREPAFAGAEHSLRTAGNEQGLTGQCLDMLVNLQMRAIRQIVTELDASGSSRKGVAGAARRSPARPSTRRRTSGGD